MTDKRAQKISAFFVLLSFLIFTQCEESEQVLQEKIDPFAREGWLLTWHDEFDADSLDPTAWIVADGHWSNNGEEQYYAPDEVYLHEGTLRLRSRYRQYEGQNYTSGHVNSTYYQRYGRIDISARMPGTRGMWPALWLLPVSHSWPPEIDILELIGHDPNTIHMSVHWGPLSDGKPPWELGQTATQHYSGPDFTEDFHLFSLEWDSDSLRWLVDEEVKFVSTLGIPHEPMYLIMNTAVGGGWPGSPDQTTVFPQFHDIDYVRFYEKNETD